MTSVVFIVFFVGLFQCSVACEKTSRGINTFGPECQYMCHCVDGAACDVSSGACTNGCGPGWYGPGCQFRDLAYKKLSKHNGNINHAKWANRATDGDSETCSYTDINTTRWWRVWLPSNETIHELTILTNEDGKGYFSSFTITVEYVPYAERNNNDYTPGYHEICHQTTNRTAVSITINVLCEQPLSGNQIRIQLNHVNAQLVLCDVRINGERNVAFGSNVTASSTEATQYSPINAVDGYLEYKPKAVCFSSEMLGNSWLRVDLGREMYVTFVNITKRNNIRLQHYVIEVSSNIMSDFWTTIYNDSPNSTPSLKVSLNVTTRYLRLRREGERIIICELQIFGSCPPNKCGYGCTEECHCKGAETLENRIKGICTTGCDEGWTGINGKCTVCDNETWGINCNKSCGRCLRGRCNASNGSCESGCASGYKLTALCTEECQINTWGIDCNSTCGYCLDGSCNASNGVCTSGCQSGYRNTTYCKKVCANGTWGLNCNKTCGRCLSGTCSASNGSCESGCASGYKTTHLCTDVCNNGTWGLNCNQTCGSCLGGTCNASDGSCKSGCAGGYKNTTRCTEVCANGTWGLNCNKTCGSCLSGTCNASNGSCESGCASGYKTSHLCTDVCDNGTWGINCTKACGSCLSGVCITSNGSCKSGCESGYKTTSLCTEACQNKTWGINCNETCGNCLHDMCNASNGVCTSGCKSGNKNTTHCNEECDNGTWGYDCNTSCGSCNEGVCNKTDGVCESGCSSGYLDSPLCTEECENGTWGYNCSNACSNCLDGPCDKSDGKCQFGCTDGYKNTSHCDEACQGGFYGDNCKHTCSTNCAEQLCHHVNGSCTYGCAAGWQGEICNQACMSGTYGIECKNTCSINCQETCNHVDGHCTKCKAGWNGTLCDTECYNGTYGDGCSLVCGKCKDSAACHKINGTCTVGCATEYEGSLCNIKTEPLVADFPTGAVAGSVSSLIVIATVAVGVIFLLRRRHLSLKSRASTSSLQDIGLKVKSTGEEPDINIKKSDGQNDEYYQFEGNVTLENQPRAIVVNELAEFVKTRLTNKEFFDKEFQAIPYGLQFPTTEARKVHNAGKNRYKAMYAYDHSRVVLSTLPSNPHSDYINANYIKGYQKERAYIATQGPTETNVADFWRMVWEKDVQVIAMVTNLVENTKQKCIQYWVPVDDSKEYGDFTVYTESEEIFAEFSIRRFKLSKQGETIQRNIVQYAYTAWPDKDVPSSTCSLLHFWNKVRKNDENKTHPWLVHCSAGVGRTGTFIALDILYDEAKDVGYVDINMCVRKLREQRVNMVQKEAQYAYLYRIMVEALVLPSTPIALSQFDPWYNEQLGFDSTTGKPKLMLEFEKMVDDIVFVSNTDDKKNEANDCVYANTQIDVNKSKNRYSNILAADEFRPFLSTYVPGTNNYINAVYMPSYNDLHGYLMAQTPLPDTAVDCCRLIIEQEIHVIVTFDDDGDNQVGIYLPSNGSIDIGPFKVTLTSKEEENGYMIQKYCIVYKTKEHTVIQYIYKKWSTYTIVPEEPFHVLEFLHKVDEQDRLFDNKPTLIQCLNGAERSGLFVVLMNVIERARMDEEVSIPQVIRYLRTRRQQIVPNYDQYKFCHDVILCYAESNSTYANM